MTFCLAATECLLRDRCCAHKHDLTDSSHHLSEREGVPWSSLNVCFPDCPPGGRHITCLSQANKWWSWESQVTTTAVSVLMCPARFTFWSTVSIARKGGGAGEGTPRACRRHAGLWDPKRHLSPQLPPIHTTHMHARTHTIPSVRLVNPHNSLRQQ